MSLRALCSLSRLPFRQATSLRPAVAIAPSFAAQRTAISSLQCRALHPSSRINQRRHLSTANEVTDGKEAGLPKGTDQLLLQGWELHIDDGQHVLVKRFKFKTYTKCQDFFNLIAIRSKSAQHHPTIIVKFRSVEVHWTTHNPASLTDLDVTMAGVCDEEARRVGCVV